MQLNKKIALTGGGTLGHITPNIALIPDLIKNNFDIIYIGSKNSQEKGIVEDENIPFFSITADKLRRYHDFKNFLMPINVIKGINEAIKILKNEKVDIVFSKGGYVALPVVIAASRLSIPVISHEADFTPGLANKISTPFSKKVCTNFPETAKMINNNKGIYTGCPIRPNLLLGSKEEGLKILGFKENKPIMLVIGGSLGSIYINSLIRKNLKILTQKYNIIHCCGIGKVDLFYKKKSLECINPLFKFVHNGIIYEDAIDSYKQIEIIKNDLKNIYKASDIIISRAGANAIFEILALKKPNILIPLSLRASRGDQILNAKSFEKQGFSKVLMEEEIDNDNEIFIKAVDELFENQKVYIDKMISANKINAGEKITQILIDAIKK